MSKKKDKKKAERKEEKKQPFKAKRIRMLMSVANEKDAFDCGAVYRVGKDITPETAESYIRTGVAEEDTSLDVPEETKAISEAEVPEEKVEIEKK